MKIPLIDQTTNPWLALSLSVSGAARQGATLPWPRTLDPKLLFLPTPVLFFYTATFLLVNPLDIGLFGSHCPQPTRSLVSPDPETVPL